MDLKEEGAADSCHQLKMCTELGECWSGRVATIPPGLVMMFALGKQEERRFPLPDPVRIPSDRAPLKAREGQQQDDCQESLENGMLTQAVEVKIPQDDDQLDAGKKSEHGAWAAAVVEVNHCASMPQTCQIGTKIS